MYKKIIVILVLAAVGMSLCLTGCGVNINMGNGLSDFSYADAENYSVGAAEFSETVELMRPLGLEKKKLLPALIFYGDMAIFLQYDLQN